MGKVQSFEIEGRLMGMNDYTNKNRSHYQAGGRSKKQQDEACQWYIKKARLTPVVDYPVILKIRWYEEAARRDVDNIVSAKKFVLDALVKNGILRNDTQTYVAGIFDLVLKDRDRPRIEVEIHEGVEENICVLLIGNKKAL